MKTKITKGILSDGLNLQKKQPAPLSQAEVGDKLYCKYYYTPEECVKYGVDRIHTPGQYYKVLMTEGNDTIVIDTDPSGTRNHRIHLSGNAWAGGYTADDFFVLYKNPSKINEGLNLVKKSKHPITSWLNAIPNLSNIVQYDFNMDNFLDDLRDRAYNFTKELGPAEYIVDINFDDITYVHHTQTVLDWIKLRLVNQDPAHLSGIEFESIVRVLSGYIRTFPCFNNLSWVISYDGDNEYVSMSIEFVNDPTVYQMDVLNEGLNLPIKTWTDDEQLIKSYLSEYDVYKFKMFPDKDFYFKDGTNGFITDDNTIFVYDEVMKDLRYELDLNIDDDEYLLGIIMSVFNYVYHGQFNDIAEDSTEFDLENMIQSDKTPDESQVNEGLNLVKKKPSVQNAPVGTILRRKEYYSEEEHRRRYFIPNKFYRVVARRNFDHSITISTEMSNYNLTFPNHWESDGWTIDRIFERTDQTVNENIILSKSYLEETSIIRDGQTSWVKLAGPVGWFEKNQYRYGTVRELYRNLNENVIALIKPDDNPQDMSREMNVNELHSGVVG